jgi:Branched-chain amino acid aminotransferase/4-amino-4-deoxychorismate lyase
MESALRRSFPQGCELIETFRWAPGEGAARLPWHLARLAFSARQLGFVFKAEPVEAAVAELAASTPLRCRLTLAREGAFSLTTAPLAPTVAPWRVAVHGASVPSKASWLRFKTTERALYDAARAALPPDIDEWLFLNERDELCEGTITNLFLEMPDGTWWTPPLRAGCLPGVLRAGLVQEGRVRVARLTLADLRRAKALYMGNALRGLIPAEIST